MTVKKHLFLITSCLLLIIAEPSTANEGFLSSTFNDRPIFIPKPYDQGCVLEPHINIELVQVGAIYPTFSPSRKSRKDYIAEKDMGNYVHLQINPIRKKELTFTQFAEKTLNYSKQTFTESKYGLDKASEPYKDFQQQSDRWVERINGQPVSFISCTTIAFDTKYVPELEGDPKNYPCSHNFFVRDHRQLPLRFFQQNEYYLFSSSNIDPPLHGTNWHLL